MDVLGSVLQELRFESTEYRSLRLGAPFRVSFAEPGLRGVHVVVEGECEVSVSGRPPHRLRAGDLVLFPRGDAHVLHAGRCAVRPSPALPSPWRPSGGWTFALGVPARRR